MKKTLQILAILFFTGIYAQGPCGFDHFQNQLEKENPEVKRNREIAEAKLLNTNIQEYLEKIGATTSRSEGYTGAIYEIPVVVHVIESSNTSLNRTDAQIQAWIENANKMYATTYGNGYYTEGTGVDGGTIIPFKLVLAKRNPQCAATTGIKRYNGSTLTGYNEYGVKSQGDNGVTTDQIKTLAPHWPESSYYNMYVVAGFDGNFSTSGLMGWASFPSNPDSSYETFMKATVVTNAHDSTLAHEFGHSLGLHHPFNGASSQGGACPTNNNCTTDNDMVCDTEPTQSLISVFPTPSNTDTNPCTSANYQGVQYNIMNYTNSNRKFTPGQRTRALAMFMQSRGNLTTSLGATAPSAGSSSVTAASCVVTGVANSTGDASTSYGAGPVKVVLGTINNPSSAIDGLGSNAYVDYASQSCLNKIFSTEIPKTTQSTIKISITGANSQSIKAWIDYNNNGSFEDSEVIVNESSVAGPGWNLTTEKTYTFTPPASAVVNTNLRMRVAADLASTINPCGQYSYGQAEDYIVKISTTLGVDEVKSSDNYVVLYDNQTQFINLLDTKENFGEYQIFDASGKLIQKGNVKKQMIKFNISNPKGIYIIKFKHQGEEVSHKFLK